MGIEILLCVACIPIILMCMYIYRKDRDKEPTKTLRKLFIYGALSIIPIIALEYLTSKVIAFDNTNIVILFINVFVTVGLIEEGAKWVIVNKTVYNDIEFNHLYDAIIYCVFVSLGFALIENINYVFSAGILTGVLRSVTTIPTHTFTAILMGYYLGKSKEADIKSDEKLAKKNMFYSLIVPILCHTLYDFLIFRQTTLATLWFMVLIVFMYIMSIIIVKKISIIDKNFDGSAYDSKERTKFISETDLFVDSLIKVMVITLILIAISTIMLFT